MSQVEIGGGTNYSRVGIYDSRHIDNKLSSRIIPDITSVIEYRYYFNANNDACVCFVNAANELNDKSRTSKY